MEAIRLAKTALSIMTDDAGKATSLRVLSILLTEKSRLSKSYRQVEEAVDCAIQSLDLSHGNAGQRSVFMMALASATAEKYNKINLKRIPYEAFGLAADTPAVIMDYARMCGEFEKPEYFEKQMAWVALASLGRGRGMLLSSITRSLSNSVNLENNQLKLVTPLTSQQADLRKRSVPS